MTNEIMSFLGYTKLRTKISKNINYNKKIKFMEITEFKREIEMVNLRLGKTQEYL